MRLVSLCPSLTELLHDLGAVTEVVGRTRFCVHPSPWVDGIERVGGTKNPKIERIVALAPDLVVMNEEENRREDADALRLAGVRVLSSLPRTVEETAQMVREIAHAIGRDAAGARIADDILARAERVRGASRAAPDVAFAYLIWRAPWMTISGDTFISALLSLAGGRNVFGGADHALPTVTLDELRAASPDVVFLSSEPFPFTAVHAAEVAHELGIDEGRVVLCDGEMLSWHGSRTPAGIDYAESLIAAQRRAGERFHSGGRSAGALREQWRDCGLETPVGRARDTARTDAIRPTPVVCERVRSGAIVRRVRASHFPLRPRNSPMSNALAVDGRGALSRWSRSS